MKSTSLLSSSEPRDAINPQVSLNVAWSLVANSPLIALFCSPTLESTAATFFYNILRSFARWRVWRSRDSLALASRILISDSEMERRCSSQAITASAQAA